MHRTETNSLHSDVEVCFVAISVAYKVFYRIELLSVGLTTKRAGLSKRLALYLNLNENICKKNPVSTL